MKTHAIVCLALLASLSLSPVCHLFAAEPTETLDVWPGDAPGEKGGIGPEKLDDRPRPDRPAEAPVMRLTNVTRPTLAVFKPPKDKDTGAAVIICPGGGYSILAYDKEGTEVAEWLNSIGVTGIVLKYRVPKRDGDEAHELPLADAQRAVSLVRSQATAWEIDPNRIGILGFSAGGNLAARASTSFDRRAYSPIDAVDQVSCRPDFAVLLYPAYLVEEGRLPEVYRVTKETPPVFFAHADDDRVSSEGSALLYVALKRAGINAELHIYSSGGHGFGLRPSANAISKWPDLCHAWLEAKGLLAKR